MALTKQIVFGFTASGIASRQKLYAGFFCHYLFLSEGAQVAIVQLLLCGSAIHHVKIDVHSVVFYPSDLCFFYSLYAV